MPDQPMTDIDRVRLALAMNDAGYKWEAPSYEEIASLLAEYDNAHLDSLRLHGEKMDLYEALLKIVCSPTIESVCGWYDEIKAARALVGPSAKSDAAPAA